MKKLVWVAGLVLLLSFVFPNGLSLPGGKPEVDVDVVSAPQDPQIVKLLAKADAADKRRIVSVYTGLGTVLKRDAVKKRLKTTEQWAEVQGETLDLAIDPANVNKYPGLDVAINDVFLRVLGTDDVLPGNDDTRGKLLEACDIIVSSAQ